MNKFYGLVVAFKGGFYCSLYKGVNTDPWIRLLTAVSPRNCKVNSAGLYCSDWHVSVKQTHECAVRRHSHHHTYCCVLFSEKNRTTKKKTRPPTMYFVFFGFLHRPAYRRLQTNLNLQTTSLACRENMLLLVCSLSLMSVSSAPRMGVCFVQLPF